MTRYLALAALLAVASPAFAKNPVQTTDDGTYTWTELVERWPDLTKAIYSEADANNDGRITAEELQALIDAGKLPA